MQLQFPPQTKSAKILWLGVVCLGFTGAGILIGKSYMEWQEKPIATTITTYPIDDLQFPQVTICPPKDSNTALYHDLVKAGNRTLSDEIRKTLRKAAYDIFIEQTHMAYTKAMLSVSDRDNVGQIFQGFHSIPKPYNDESCLKIKMWNLNGTMTAPWFGGDYVEEYYEEDREFFMVLELPKDIRDQVGGGSLFIDLNVDTRDETSWVEEVRTGLMPNFTLHSTKKNCQMPHEEK